MNMIKTTLGEISIGKGQYGIGAAAVEYSKELYTYLRITDINDDGTLSHVDKKSVDDPKAQDYLLSLNDIVFARTGNSTGRNYFYDGTDGEYVYAGFLIKFSLDPSKVNPRYIKYYCLSDDYKGWVKGYSTGSTRGNINAQTYANMEIMLPPREHQDKMVKILDDLEAKIKVNNAINRNLEEQLTAIYNVWFGKYKPFNIGIGGDPGYKLKDGWKIQDIYSIANIIYGAPFASKLFNREGDGIPIVRIRDLKCQELVTYTTEQHPKGYLIQQGDIVVGMDGEFRPYIWGNDKAWLNQRVCVFNNIRENGKAYLYCTIKPLLYSVEATEVATTVIHIGKKDYDEFRVVIPPDDILNKFEIISKPMYDQIVEGQVENRRLSKLRDVLLPKLISGELDVTKLEI